MDNCSLSNYTSSYYNAENALSASWDVPSVDAWVFESKELSFLVCDSFPNLSSQNLPGISHRAWLIDVLNWETLSPVTKQKETGGGRPGLWPQLAH